MALVLLSSLLLLAAPQSARAQTEIWDATLTVGADGNSRGFLRSPSRGSLSDRTFEAGGVSFTIRALFEIHATNRKFICVSFQAGYTGHHAATTALSALTLNLGGHTLPFEGINHGQRPWGDYCWFIPGPAEEFGFETGSTLRASIVTSAPQPTAQIVSRPRDGTSYRSGEVIRVVLWFEEDVRVTGSPQLELDIGGQTRLADYVPARRGRTAAFEYTVTADDADADGVSIRANTDASSPSLRLNDGEFLWVSFLRGEVVDLGFGAVLAGAGHAVDGANADTTAPVLSAATIRYGLLELTYSKPLRSDPQMMSGVATSAWSVSVNGAPAALTAAYIIGTVRLILQSPVDHDDVVTVSSSVLMQDRAEPPNTEAALLDGHSVTNETPAAKPVVEIAADADALFEGEAILLTVTRTGETAQPLRVTVSFSNPALLGLAFPTVYLPAGASSGRATVPTRRRRPPGDRPLVISLVPDDPYVIGEASSVSVTVKDVDVPVAVSIGASLNIANEPPTAGAIDYVAVVAEALEESPVAPEFRFLFSTQPGTAEKDKDYRAQDHRLGFRAEDFAFVTRRLGGQEVQRWQATRSIPIEYLGDDEAEGDEYFTVHVEADSTTPENVTFFERPLKVIIRDSDLDIDVAIQDPPSQIAENAGRSHITLAATVRQPSTPGVSSGVRLTLEEDSASVPEDVAWAGSNSRTIPVDLPASLYRPVTENGATRWRAVVSVPLLVHDDDIEEERERFRVNLTRDSQAPNSGYVEIARATNSARLTIVDDDRRGLVVNPTALDLAPGAEGSYTVALASEPTADVTVAASVPAADAGAVSLSPSSLAFTPGNWDTPQSLTVTAADDADGRTVEIANQAAGGDYGVVDPVAVEVEIASGAMQPAPPALAVSDAAASEADAEIAFTVSLDAAGTREVTVSYETENGTAEAGADFTGTDGVLTFAAGETSRIVDVPVVDDDAAEPGESFSLRLRAPVNAVLGDALGVGRITDDDDLPMLSVTGATVSESDGAVDFDLTLSAASGREVSVQIRTDDGTAVQGRDYGAVVGEVRFAAGETHRVVGVAVTDDLVDEPDLETFTLTLSSPENATLATATATGSIRDDDVAPVVSARDTTAAEIGGEMAFSVVLTSRTESTVTVDYETVDVTATAGSDYLSASGTLTFAPGETAKSVAVTLLQDTVAEGDEVLTLSLDDAQNARLGASGDGTIRDGGAPTLRIADATAAEASGALEFVVTASGAAAREMRVDYATRDGTATAGQDYTETQGTLVFAVGETTKTIRVPVAMDSQDDEGLEALTVVLSGAVNATLADSEATGTISDTALPRLSVSDVSVEEGDDAVFAVSLTAAAAQDVSFRYRTADGTATAGADYTEASGRLTIPAGGTEASIAVSTAEDGLDEDDEETFEVRLEQPLYATIADGAATGTIRDADPTPTLSVGNATTDEGESLQFAVELSAASELEVTVEYETADGTAESPADYTETTGTLTFGPGETERAVPVPVYQDRLEEDTEYLSLVLKSPMNAGFDRAEELARGFILDDDDPPVLGLVLDPIEVAEQGETSAVLTVEIAGDSAFAEDTTVGLALSGPAQAGVDYRVTDAEGNALADPWELVLAAGEDSVTATIQAIDDEVDEEVETVTIGAVRDRSEVGSPLTLRIADDDEAGVVVSPAALTLAEGGTKTYTVALASEPTASVTVTVSSDNEDVTADGPLTFTASDWSTAQTVTVTAAQDANATDDTATLTNTAEGGGYDGESAGVTVTVTDDDTAPTAIALTVSPASVEEDDGATTVTVTATLDGSATLGTATEVRVSVGGGTATSGTDYTAVDAFTVTIGANESSGTGTFTLTPTNDSLAEGDETIDVTGTATGFTVTGAQVTLTDDTPPVEVGFARASYTVAEGGTVTVTVELSAVPEREVEVALTHTAQDDTTAADYSGVPTSVTFGSSETEQTFTFTAAADDVDDDGDSVLLKFGTPLPDGVSEGETATSTVSITDDDDPRVQVFFEPAAYTVAEDSAVTVTVRLDVAPERLVSVPITVANQGDTTAADYSGAPTLVVFAGDETEQSFRFGASDDTVDDDGESVVLGFGELPDRVSAPDTTARPATATVSITDDDTALASITLTTLPVSVSESASGTTVTVTATLDGSVTRSSATDVVVSVGGGSATSGTDYTAVSDFTVTIPAQSASGTGTFTLTPANDSIAEGDEIIDVTGSAADFTVTKAQVTLTDDDTAPTAITLSVSPASVSESASGTTVTVTATLDGSATLLTATTVTVSVGGGSATSGTDYTAVSDFTVTIPKESARGTGTFTLTPTNDAIAEGDETIDVTGTADGFTVTKAEMTLTDDETAPASIALTVSPTSVSEDDGATTVTVTATLGGSATLPDATEVTVSVGGGSATSGTDYTAVSDFTVTIPKESARGTGTFTLTPTNDSLAEGEETIDVTGMATDFTVTKAQVTLTDDTPSVEVGFARASYTVAEGSTVTVTVELSAVPEREVEVALTHTAQGDTTAADYSGVPTSVTFGSSETEQTFTFTATADDVDDDGDSVLLGFGTLPDEVSAPDTTARPASATVSITDDDVPPVQVFFEPAAYTVAEDSAIAVTVRLDVAPERLVSVPITVANQGDTTAADYSGAPTIVVFAGDETEQSFSFGARDDTVDDDGESVVLGFGELPARVSAPDTTARPASATVSITDDDTALASITLTTLPVSVSESASGTTVTVTATLDGSVTLPGATEVTVSVGGGTATSGTDYAAVSGFTVTIPKETSSGTGTFTLTPTNDAIAEGDETIDMTGSATDFTVTQAEMTLTDDETAPGSITLTTSPTSVSESGSGTTVTVTATLDGSVTLPGATEVAVSVGGGTATSGTDYGEVADFTVTIPKESARGTGTFTLTPTQDSLAEGDETIDVTGSATDFTVTQAEMTLTDDETAPGSITLTTSPTSVSESGSGTTVTVTATLDGSATLLSATTVTVSVGGGSATSGTDYAAVSSFTVTIPKESARGTATFTLTPTNDAIAEGDETIDVTGTADGFTVTKAEVTVTDDETAPTAITLTASPTSVSESASGTTVTVTATLGGSATLPGATEVSVSVGGGTATSGTDYAAVPDFTVTIPRESARGTGTFTLTPANDSIAEGDESIDVTGSATDFTVTQAEVTLTDDETAPGSITLSVSPTSVEEDDGATTVTVTATLGGTATLPGATEVSVSVGGGTATSGTDYAAVSDFTVTIPKESARGTGTFTLTPTNDAIAEGDETIDVTGTADGFTVTKAEVTLTDDETAPASITLTTSPTSVLESGSGTTVTVTATLDGSATLLTATTVTVSVGGGSATSGTDYAAVSSFTVTIPKESARGTGTFTLTPTNDAIAEGDETIDVTGTADGFTVTKAEVTLTDDDTAPTAITLTASPTSVLESASGTTVTVTATLDGSATLLTATTVTVSVGGGTATSGTDYAAVSDFAVTIPAETASGTGTFTLTPTNDAIAEGDETIDVTGSATDFTVTKAEVTLTDDETAPASITLTTSPTSVLESASGTTVTVTATLGGSATRPGATDVVVSVGGGSATSGTDYAAVSSFTVTIGAGDSSGRGTFTLTPTNDSLAEGDETIDVTGSATDFTVTKAEMTLTDDETAPGSITLSVSPTSVEEDDGATTVTVTATLDGSVTLPGATQVTVSVGGGTATSGTDYAAVPDFTVTIPKESARGTGTFTLTPTQDSLAEGDETIDVTGNATDFTVTEAEITLTDDDTAPTAITLTTSPTSVSESASGTTVTVTARLDGSATLLTATEVAVSVGGGTATSGTDYAAVSDFTVTIPKESASGSGTFTLTPMQDSIAEGDETIDVTGTADDFTVTKAEVTLTDDETAPGSITLTVSPTSVGEDDGLTTVTVTATLGGSATLLTATGVAVSVGGGTATSGTDYAAVSDFTVTIPKETASGSGTFTLTPTQDSLAEGDETIDVTGSATDFTVTKAEMTLTDDETAPGSITLTTSPTSVSESASGTTVTVTATLGGSATLPGATEVSVSVGGGTATSGTDYAAVPDFTVTIPKESASGSGTFTLTPTQDTIAEGDETIDVTGTADDFTVTKAQVTLTDDETAPASITLTVSPTSVSEDDGTTTVTVTATLDGSATLLTATEVTVSVGGGTAISGTDYTAVDAFTVTIGANESSGTGTFTLTPTNDSLAEGDETIEVTGSATDFTVTQAQVTLTDDVPRVQVFFEPDAYTVAEDSAVTVTVRLDVAPERLVSVPITVANQGDTSAADYSGAPTIVVFAGDETEQSFPFGASDDTVDDDGESVVLGLGELPDRVSAPDTTARPASATVSITDDDTASAAITLTTSPTSVLESASGTTVTVTATLGGSATRPSATDVVVSVGGGSATSGTDYAAVSSFTVTIPKETASASETFTLTPTQDTIAEGDETIDVTGSAAGFTVTKAEITLTDNDVPQRTVSFDKQSFTVREGATRQALMQVDLSGSVDREVTIPLTTTHGSGVEANDYDLAAIGAEDYYAGNDTWTSLDGNLVFAPAETGKILQVTAVDDSLVEDDEVLELGFGTLPEGISPGPILVARVTITDNDGSATPTPGVTLRLSDADGEVAEDAGAVTVTATVLPASAAAFTVTVSASPVAPATDADFELSANRTLRFAENATASTGTVTIAPVDDGDAEPTQVVTVSGSASVAGVTDPDDMTLTILDDDVLRIRGICDRTPRVRDRILVRLKYQHGFKDTCAEVTEAHLEKLTLLDLRRNPSNESAFTLSLQRHDFEGLSNLVELDLADTGLASLPAGVFDGLAILETLNLNKNRLGSLPPGVFAGLRSLETLRLQKNPSLRSLPYDELEALPALTLLRVDRVGRRKLQVAGGEGDAALEVAAGGSATYRVRLMAAPDFRITAANPVRIGVSSDTAGVTATPATLPFTREDWFRRQTVTVRAETSASGATATLAHEPSGTTTDSQGQAQSNYDFESYPLPKVTVRVAGGAGRGADGASATVAGAVDMAVADARVEEGAGAVLAFAVTLSRAASGTVTVDYATADGSAQAGVDYTAASGTLTFRAGESSRTIEVTALDDSHDEGEETFTLRLSNASGARVTDGEATGTIKNSDPLPRALMGRFGRTAAAQLVEQVEARLEASREPGFRGRVAGRELRRGMAQEVALNFLQQLGAALGTPGRGGGALMMGAGGPMSGAAGMAVGGAALQRPGRGAAGFGGGAALQRPGRGAAGFGGGDLLTGSDFAMNRESRGGILSFWSRGAQSRFSGREGALSLGGDVRTTMFGADHARGPLVAGLSLSNSRGLGEYAGAAGGQVASSVTGLYPWLGYQATDRVKVWGLAGYGTGGLLLTPQSGQALESGLSMAMAAAGTRGELVAGGSGGFALAFKADALWVGTAIDGVDGPAGRLKATDAAVTRFRTGLEGSRAYRLAGRLSLTPSVEVGLRRDGGDAETGAGLDVGGGLVVSDSGAGLAVDVRVRTLLVHQDKDFSGRGVAVSLSYNPTPSTPLGFMARVAPSWGGQATRGAEALWGRETMGGMAHGGGAQGNSLDAEVGYGVPVGSRLVGTPKLGLRTSAHGKDYRLGYSLGVLSRERLALELGVEAQRRENAMQGGATNGVLGRASLSW